MTRDPIKLYEENMFSAIAKLLTKFAVRKELGKAMDDPNLQSSIESLRWHAEEAERQLKNLCRDYPELDKCKKLSKGK